MIFLNLAMFNYKKLVESKDSPLDYYNIIELSSNDSRKMYEVHSFLKKEFKSKKIEESNLYGISDATGTHQFKHIAIWKSFSELIERWAFYTLIELQSSEYGLNIDATTTGFSALPCWPKSVARKFSFGEAAERWVLSNWWRGFIKPTYVDMEKKLVLFNLARKSGLVVIRYEIINCGSSKKTCYGFAHGNSITQATIKAQIEMERNKRVILSQNLKTPATISDKRLIFFSTDNGFDVFSERIRSFGYEDIALPTLCVDTLVSGPWSEYASVWRCLFPGTDYAWNDMTHFMF